MARGDVGFFNRVAAAYDYVMPAADPRVFRTAFTRADREINRVLDIGGGTGRGILAVDASERVVLDASINMLKQAPPDIHRVLGSATDVPVDDASVDAVLIIDALHHLPAPETVLAESARVLRAGGVVVIREFNRATRRGKVLAVAERMIGMESSFFTVDELAELVDQDFRTAILNRGFTCTVVGRKPRRSSGCH